METEESFADKFRKQRSFEESMAKACAALCEKVENAAAKMLLTELQLDTAKHARIFEEILNTIEKAPPANLWDYRIASYVDSLVVKKELERHLKLEQKMLEDLEAIIKDTKDEALKLLLEHIAADERKHHEIVETILRKSYVLTK
jgi:rubrerythrin